MTSVSVTLTQQTREMLYFYWAFRAACCGKRNRAAVAAFEFDLERNLWRLQEELSQQTYQPGSYTNFYVYEPKRRLVSAAPFRG
jgi:RNA-directed DNA polymerase